MQILKRRKRIDLAEKKPANAPFPLPPFPSFVCPPLCVLLHGQAFFSFFFFHYSSIYIWVFASSCWKAADFLLLPLVKKCANTQ
jgi:hypothetical protein